MGQVSISGKDYEIYGTQDGANTYFGGSLNSSAGWAEATFEDQQKALVTAGRMFDRTRWVGTPTEPPTREQPQPTGTQPLEWPRVGAVDCNGAPVPSDEIPEDIIAGSYELANALLLPAGDTLEAKPGTGSNVKSDLLTEKVDVLSTTTRVEYFRPTIGKASRYPTQVHEYIRCFLSGANAVGPYATGLNDDSAFDDDFGLTFPGFP